MSEVITWTTITCKCGEKHRQATEINGKPVAHVASCEACLDELAKKWLDDDAF